MQAVVLYTVLTVVAFILAYAHTRAAERTHIPAVYYLAAVLFLEGVEIAVLAVASYEVFVLGDSSASLLIVARLVTVGRFGLVAGFLLGAHYGVRSATPRLGVVSYAARGWAALFSISLRRARAGFSRARTRQARRWRRDPGGKPSGEPEDGTGDGLA